MTRQIEFAPEEYYHLYNRGTEKRKIFQNKADYERFLALLYLANGSETIRLDNLSRAKGKTLLSAALGETRGEPLIDICAYCLMPNHFHILARERSDSGISTFMQKLTTAYAMYFNMRYQRVGALFQGKYKAEHAGNDRYLKYLVSYIHLNPVKLIDSKWKENGIKDQSRTKEFLEKFRYSSFADYAGTKRPERKIVDTTALPEYFESPATFRKSVHDWLEYADPGV